MTSAEERHARLYLRVAQDSNGDPATLRRWLLSIRRAWQFAKDDDELTLEFVAAMQDFFRLQGMGREYV